MCQPVLVLSHSTHNFKSLLQLPSMWCSNQLHLIAFPNVHCSMSLTVAKEGHSILPSQHFPASCFQSEHFPIWTFSIWVFPIWTFPIWVFPKSEMKKFEHFQFENFQSWYDMLQPSAKSVKLAIHWNCQLLWMTWFASNEKWMTTPPACKLSK